MWSVPRTNNLRESKSLSFSRSSTQSPLIILTGSPPITDLEPLNSPTPTAGSTLLLIPPNSTSKPPSKPTPTLDTTTSTKDFPSSSMPSMVSAALPSKTEVDALLSALTSLLTQSTLLPSPPTKLQMSPTL